MSALKHFLIRVRFGLTGSGVLSPTMDRRVLVAEDWAELLDDISDEELAEHNCWSVTSGQMGESPILVLFADKTLHPHYPPATT